MMNLLGYSEEIFIAGYFEARGVICLQKQKNKNSDDSIKARIIFSNKDAATINQLYEIIGAGRVSGPHPTKTKDGGGSFYRLAINTKPEVIELLNIIRPHVSTSKQQYIDDKLSCTQNWSYRTPVKPIECPICSKSHYNKVYCSRECSAKGHIVDRVELQCKSCGTTVRRTKAEIKYLQRSNIKETFCGSRCAAKHYNNLGELTRKKEDNG